MSKIQKALRDWKTLPRDVKGLPAPATANTCTYIPTREINIHPASERLVITVATGKLGRELLDISGPAMRRYAGKIGADFFAITDTTQTWHMAEKFRVGSFAAHYQRVLYVDADVFIRETAPDVFAVIPSGRIAVHNDSPAAHGTWPADEQKTLGDSQGVEIPTALWNTGIVIFDGADADIWDAPRRPFPIAHCMEQWWVQTNIIATRRLVSLPPVWNWQYWLDPELTGIADAHFIHLSGMVENVRMRPALMRALALSLS